MTTAVIGSSRGIGLAVANTLLHHGADVLINGDGSVVSLTWYRSPAGIEGV